MSTSYTPRPHSRAASVALNEIGYERGSASVARHKRHAKSNGVQITAQSESEAFPVVNGRRRYEPSEPEVNGRAVDSRTRQTAPRPKSPVEAPEETSFVAESSFVRAPLNSRLVNRPSNPPVPSSVSSRKSKGKEKERAPSSLHGVPLDIQEALVLEDLLYVLMGIPGAYITIDPTYDPDSREGVKFVTNHTLDQWKLKILLAGKYLNVIRECGIDVTQGSLQNQTKDDTPKEGAKQPHSLDDERFYQTIEDAYTFANRTLLQLLVKDQDLIPRLRSLKYYFFLSRSAYLGGFFENSRIELSKTVKLVSINKLQSLYDLALASSPGPEDGGFRGDMKLTMASSTLWDFLTTILSIEGTSDEANLAMGLDPDARSKDKAKEKDSKDSASMLGEESALDICRPATNQALAIDALALDYNVKFPLSLVISRKAILHYQLLFRFLLQLKNTEQALTDMWMEHKAPPWSSRSAHADLERWKMSVVLLRSQMLAFVQTILGYATSSILEATWKELEGKLVKLGKEQSQGTVDQLLRDHWDFLNTCMKGCLLTTAKFLRLYSSLLHTSTRFAAFNLRMTRTLEQAIQALADGDSELTTSPMNKRWDTLQKFQTHFQHHYNAFTDQVSYNSANEVALLPLAYRLNQGRLGDRGSGSLL
ncbi:hypothetical protein FRB99_007776 [Tulasnella sp. 403]|nr:hypothetical protein FRB99_007776 [Tulasnella sp. 403]